MKTDKKKGIAFVAPSSAIPDHTVLDRAASYFSAHGYCVTAPEATWSKHQRFAGTDDERLAALNEVIADKSVQLILQARGGYGLSRLMHRINWTKLANSGKQLMGYSDFTAINLALLAKAGAPSLHGPSATGFGGNVVSSFTEDHFWSVFETHTFDIKVKVAKQPKVQVQGTLWGGNLAVFCAMLGTPYMPNVKNGILFFEDVSEHPYRLERMLLQLKHAGILDTQRAIVLGQFTNYLLGNNDNGFNLAQVINHVRTFTKTPILTDLPFGHVQDQITMPYGETVTLQSIKGGYRLFN
jgi:muramoyltetrapeptide carboxypeptidase